MLVLLAAGQRFGGGKWGEGDFTRREDHVSDGASRSIMARNGDLRAKHALYSAHMRGGGVKMVYGKYVLA